jgi:hypothetical protein
MLKIGWGTQIGFRISIYLNLFLEHDNFMPLLRMKLPHLSKNLFSLLD